MTVMFTPVAKSRKLAVSNPSPPSITSAPVPPQHVGADAADQRVVAAPPEAYPRQLPVRTLRDLVADQRVVAGTADGVLDDRAVGDADIVGQAADDGLAASAAMLAL